MFSYAASGTPRPVSHASRRPSTPRRCFNERDQRPTRGGGPLTGPAYLHYVLRTGLTCLGWEAFVCSV